MSLKNCSFCNHFFTHHLNPRELYKLFTNCLFYGLVSFFFLSAVSASAAPSNGRLEGFVNINGSGATDAVVYLLPEDGPPPSLTPMEIAIVQEKLRFFPSFYVVTAGSTIFFQNRDDTIHNVHSKSPSNPFDLGSHLQNTVKKIVLKNPGVVLLQCNIHPEMNGLIYVSPSPFFSRTNENGYFNIVNVPPGKYRVITWHPRLTSKEAAKERSLFKVEAKTQAVILKFFARAELGKDMTDVENQDWLTVIEEIQIALDTALSRWKKKRLTSAATKVMTAHSRIYLGSGLRKVIAKNLGEPRALDHEKLFDKIRKMVQGLSKEVVSETIIQSKIQKLMADLRKDVDVIKGL